MQSIFSSIEAECWSRGFNYEDYKRFYEKLKIKGKLLSEDQYAEFCKFMNYMQFSTK